MAFQPAAATMVPVAAPATASYTLTCFDSPNFGGPALANNAVLTRGETISCLVNASAMGNDLQLIVSDCAFSTMPNGEGTNMTFISDRCVRTCDSPSCPMSGDNLVF